MNRHSDDNLDRAYAAFRVNHDALRDRLLNVLPERQRNTKRVHRHNLMHRFMRGRIMNGRLTKIAAAAAVILAVVLGIHFLGVSPDGTSVAWADVLAQMDGAQTVTFTFKSEAIYEGEEHFASEGTTQIREPFRRTEGTERHWWANGPVGEESIVAIMDLSRNKRFVLLHRARKWAYYAPDHGAHDGLLTYDGLKQDFRDGTEEYIGEKVVDGRKVVCFKVSKDDTEITVWADAEAALPVRIERQAKDGSEKTTLNDIVFDVALDDSLFDMTLPDDYVVVNLGTEKFTIPFELTEEYLVQGLKQQAVSLGGTFPTCFMRGRPGAMEKAIAQQRIAAPTETFGITNLAAEYVKRLADGSRWQYLGEDIQLGDADAIVFWYQTPDSPTCRAIYGDLTVRDIAPEDLPETSWPPTQMTFR